MAGHPLEATPRPCAPQASVARRGACGPGRGWLYLLRMAVNAGAVGKRYPPTTYAVGREKIIEFAHAVGETEPLYLDLVAARGAGYADLVAPPMFAVIFQLRAATAPLSDPEGGIDFPRMLHAGQDFRWGPLVIAGDEVTTSVTVDSIAEKGGMRFYDFAAESVNQRGETVVTGLWHNVVRPLEDGS